MKIINRKKQVREEWKCIEKVERKGILYNVVKEIYVSNHGRIKRINKNGEIIITFGSKHNKGYREVFIQYIKDGIKKRDEFTIHRLVAYAFIGTPPHYKYIPNHLDGCKYNNFIWNLEWSTYSDNNKHAIQTGLKVIGKGECHNKAKLNDVVVKIIINSFLNNLTNREIYNKIIDLGYNITISTVTDIRNKRSWKHLTNDYTFPKDSTHKSKKL